MQRLGPLVGIRIVEFAGLGPGPFCAMLLAELGADIIRLGRDDPAFPPAWKFDQRSRRVVHLNLKDPDDVARARDLCRRADAIIEGYRPGVMERLGLGPDVLIGDNPRLVYGRITGFGQTGPYAQMAGHDLNYLAVTGLLHSIGVADRPVPPLNLIGDYGGGAMFLAVGLLSGILHARETGVGQVIDAAMYEGAAYMGTIFQAFTDAKIWSDRRGTNVLDGGAPFYNCYRCSDDKWISVAAIEEHFFAVLLKQIGLDSSWIAHHMNPPMWPALRAELEQTFARKTRDEWCALLEGSDACFAPVLTLKEARSHPHAEARSSFFKTDGKLRPAPAPRFSETPLETPDGGPSPIVDFSVALESWS